MGLKWNLVMVMAAVWFLSCAGTEPEKNDNNKAGSRISSNAHGAKAVGYSDLYLDSTAVERFIREHKVDEKKAADLRDFYSNRNYQFAWFAADGLDEHGRAFWNLHNNYVNYAQDSSFFNKRLHQKMEVLVNDADEASLPADEIRELELALTEHFFDYANFAFTGKIDPRELKWHIPQKKINAVALLDSLIARNGEALHEWEPVNQQYKQLRQQLTRYYKIEKSGGWPEISGAKKVIKQGDSAAAVRQLKERLRQSGDYTDSDTSAVFTASLKDALQAAQQRFGLKPDGVAGPATLRALNKPVTDRIKQMLVNMERMRWMPASGEGKRLVANIPEYKLHVYEGAKEVFDMRIVVGKAANKTVVFNDQMKHIVFSPYWNIPASIVRNEILPAMQRNPGYLSQKNMEQTGTRNGLPVIRQKPGGSNSLGRVKFLFPNSYAIYFHDTPARSLFGQNKRAFSHGCIRLAEPQKLAVYLLQDQQAWDESRISSAMNAGTEKWVNLTEPVPVAITYFTSWAMMTGGFTSAKTFMVTIRRWLSGCLINHRK
jgi:murein L,D-transpeptidase YcbB/YkuD